MPGWTSQRYADVVIDQPRGSYKQFREPGGDYPLEGVTYPTDYGFLPGYMGEDMADLDVFRGASDRGEYGLFYVFRPDVPKRREGKFYFGLSPEEKEQVFAAFGPVLVDTPVVFAGEGELEEALGYYGTLVTDW